MPLDFVNAKEYIEQKACQTAVDAAFAQKARLSAIIALVVADAHKTAIFAAVATHK